MRPRTVPASVGTDDQLRDIQAITDTGLSHLDTEGLLAELLERTKKIVGADTATVLLLDHSARELIAAAASGLEEEVRQGVRIPLGTGFAGRIAAQQAPVILGRVDEHTVVNPLLRAKGIRTMAGAPMIVGGRVIGVMHVGSLSGRPFSADDVSLLQVAADRAAAEVSAMLARNDELAASALQRSLLPTALPQVSGAELAARFVPGHGLVGGDWYDVFFLPTGELGMVVGDVAGSGLPAAVIMGRMRSALRAYALETSDPAKVVTKLDRKMQHFEPDALATVLYAVFDPSLATARISAAGHIPPVLALPGHVGVPVEVPADLLIGADSAAPRRSAELSIPPGAVLCMCTDGLIERRESHLDQGLERLCQAVRAGPAEAACAAVMLSLVGNEDVRDDIALLMFHRLDCGDGHFQ
ncbi:MAG: SpoIIE family protein phosphatase [Actinobacteria bacterium]|nr:SpoIIE family protein phosphatase [Actinomycetota bacterium]